MDLISKDIERALAILNREGLVAIPTETVYGLAGSIYSEKAIRGIFELKRRPFFNPLIVHIGRVEQLSELVESLPPKAKQLADHFWPGPLTLVLLKKDLVPDLITAEKNTVAVRMPNHPITLDLLNRLDFPLAAPSANPFGSISPTSAEHVAGYFPSGLEMVLDGGLCKAGIESTIVGFVAEEPIIYRLGSISREEIEGVVGPVVVQNQDNSSPNAPGMLSKHYAPKTPMVLVDDATDFLAKSSDSKLGLLSFDTFIEEADVVHQECLSPRSDMREAAANLYAALHRMDALDLDLIIAQRFPDFGLGKSINDRLERASHG